MKAIRNMLLALVVFVATLAAVGNVASATLNPVSPCSTVIFDSKVGVQYYPNLNGYAATGTKGEAYVVTSAQPVTFSDHSTVTLLQEYKGGKSIGLNGWVQKDQSCKLITTGSLGFSSGKPIVVCDNGDGL